MPIQQLFGDVEGVIVLQPFRFGKRIGQGPIGRVLLYEQELAGFWLVYYLVELDDVVGG